MSLVCEGLQPSLQSNQIEPVQSIQEVIAGMRKTYAHVFMILNRCLDASQALQGLTLLPRPSTILLADAVQGPLACADLNDTAIIKISFEPMALEGELLRTDCQWLQENLLCLLSNAVKYSRLAGQCTIGDVSLCISMTTREELREEMAQHREEEQRMILAAQGSPQQKFIRFLVSDHGQVIRDAQQLRDIFAPKPASERHTGGTGLGLYSLAKRQEAMGGLYGAWKGPQGCLFWLAIPYDRDGHSLMQSCGGGSSRDGFDNSLEPEMWRLMQFVAHDRGSERSSAKLSGKGPMRRSTSTQMSSFSQPDLRTSFTLPIYAPSIYAAPTAGVSANGTGGDIISRVGSEDYDNGNDNSGCGPWSILIVDDSAVILKLTSQLLQRHGHSVVAVSSGLEALELLSRKVENNEMLFDVVLLDLQMPQLSGPETAARIREMEAAHNDTVDMEAARGVDAVRVFGSSLRHGYIRHTVVGFSAKGERSEIEQALRSGMDAFLHKPFTLQAFHQATRDAPRPHVPLQQQQV